MADLEVIRMEGEHRRETERLVISGLAGYLEEAVRMLPQDSKLCGPFLHCADGFNDMAGWPDPDSTAALALINMQSRLRRMDIGGDA